MHRNFDVPAGTCARIALDLRVEDLGAGDYTLSGAVYDAQHRSVPVAVQAAGESEDGLPAVVLPQMPVGLWQYELRAGGRPLLHGHLHVLPSPLCGEEGRCNWVVGVDPAAELARVTVDWRPAAIDYDKVGALAQQAVLEQLYDDRPALVAQKEMAGSGYVWDRGVDVVAELDGRAYAVGLYVSGLRYGYEGYVAGETPLYVRLECADTGANGGERSVDSLQAVPLGDASACPEGMEARAGWTYWPLPDDARLYGGATYTVRLYYPDAAGERVYVPYNLNSAVAQHAVAEVYGLCSAPVYPAANTLLEEACARAGADAAAAAAAADRAEAVLAHTQGVAGADGQSAYDIWLAGGNTGTQQDFLEALKGAPGPAPTAEQIQNAVDGVVYETLATQHRTIEGMGNASLHWLQLDARRVPAGSLQAIEIPCRSNAAAGVCESAVWLVLWERPEDGADWVVVGSSVEPVQQVAGQTARWEFEGVTLSGRVLRICAAEEPGVWSDSQWLGVRMAPREDGEESSGRGSANVHQVTDMTFEMVETLPKFAAAADVEGHVADASVHVTADDRARWDAAAGGGTVSGDYAAASHVGDETHLQRDGRLLRILDSSGGTALQVLGNTTNATLTAGSLYNNVPDWSLNTVAAAMYDYEMSTGVTDIWFAATTSASALAPLGIYKAGVHIGNSHYPVRLQGTEVSVNGVPLAKGGSLVSADDRTRWDGKAETALPTAKSAWHVRIGEADFKKVEDPMGAGVEVRAEDAGSFEAMCLRDPLTAPGRPEVLCCAYQGARTVDGFYVYLPDTVKAGNVIWLWGVFLDLPWESESVKRMPTRYEGLLKVKIV